MMRSWLYKLKEGTEHLNYGRDIVEEVTLQYARNKVEPIRILDLGAGHGTDLLNCMKILKGSGYNALLYAIENYKPNIQELQSSGISVSNLDIESDIYPYEDSYFDIVIMNQVLEHTKEVFHIFGEISRILKAGGICIVGVPNLASLHNRVALLFGLQPTSIRMFGPHVRGITKQDFVEFIEKGGYFQETGFAGSNFYPFPPRISTFLSKLFPKFSVSIFIIISKTDKKGNFSDLLNEYFFETSYKH